MPARTAFHPWSDGTRRASRRGTAVRSHRRTAGPEVVGLPEPIGTDIDAESRQQASEDSEQFRVASRDRLIPRQRDGQPVSPHISFEVLLALAVVVACAFGALAVGAAFTLQV